MIIATMCYVKGNLVTTLHLPGEPTHKIKVYNDINNLVKEWEPCHGLPSLMNFEIHGKEYLLEGCRTCMVIRGYEFPQIKSKILCEGISPEAMCKGPDDTILFFDTKQTSLKQLYYCDGQFLLAKDFSVDRADISGLCFSENSSTVIVLDRDRKTLTGFHFPSGRVAWQHTENQLGPSSQILTDFHHILTLPDERICVFTHKETFVLDPVDGRILYTLHHFQKPGVITAATASYNGRQQKLAVCTFPMTLSVYEVPFEPPEVTRFLL